MDQTRGKNGQGGTWTILLFCVCLHLNLAASFIYSEVVWLEDTEQNTSCTVSLSDGGSLDDLYFTLRPINYTISHEYVNIVNDTTLTLTLPRSQVTPEISSRSLFCFWKGEVLSRQHISIVGKTPQPKVFCWVDNWETFICGWKPSVKQLRDDTKHRNSTISITMSWDDGKEITNIVCNRTSCEHCGYGDDAFAIDGTNYPCFLQSAIKGQTCNISVVTHHSHWSNSTEHAYYMEHITEPPQVENLTSTSIGEYTATLIWTAPTNHPIIYFVNQTCIWQEEKYKTYDTMLTVEDLVPHTEYNMTVQTKPRVKGFLSLETSYSFMTKSAKPDVQPEVTQGGFVIHDNKITVNWKHVSERYHYGSHFSYIVIVHHGSTKLENSYTNDQWITLPLLNQEETMNIQVCSSNSLGYSTENATVLIADVRKDKEWLRGIVFSDHFVEWTPTPDGSRVLVAWCSRHYYKPTCLGEIFWTFPDMEANKSRIDHVDNMKDLLVGLATITQNNQSTGIHWITDCVYNREAVPPKPEILHSKNEGGLLSISWKNGDICPVNYGFTHYYLLLYAVALDDVDPYPVSGAKTEWIPRTANNVTVDFTHAPNKYWIWIQAVNSLNESSQSEIKQVEVTLFWYRKTEYIILLIIGLAVVLFLVICAIYAIKRWCIKLCSSWEMDVHRPERFQFVNGEGAHNATSGYGRQRSQKSEDSGYSAVEEKACFLQSPPSTAETTMENVFYPPFKADSEPNGPDSPFHDMVRGAPDGSSSGEPDYIMGNRLVRGRIPAHSLHDDVISHDNLHNGTRQGDFSIADAKLALNKFPTRPHCHSQATGDTASGSEYIDQEEVNRQAAVVAKERLSGTIDKSPTSSNPSFPMDSYVAHSDVVGMPASHDCPNQSQMNNYVPHPTFKNSGKNTTQPYSRRPISGDYVTDPLMLPSTGSHPAGNEQATTDYLPHSVFASPSAGNGCFPPAVTVVPSDRPFTPAERSLEYRGPPDEPPLTTSSPIDSTPNKPDPGYVPHAAFFPTEVPVSQAAFPNSSPFGYVTEEQLAKM